jgi:small-conductance mechanosensitive channel
MWYDTWRETISGGLNAVRDHLPAIGAAALLVFTGWVLALLSRRWSRRVSKRLLDRLGATSASINHAVESSGARVDIPGVVGGFVFWLVLLVFMAAAVETLGLPVMTDLLGKLVAYAPNLLAAILISLAGVIAARAARSAALRAAEAGGIAQARGIATIAEVVVIVLVVVIALEQLGVNGRVLELTVAITAGSALAAVALAFGLGARASVANLIASHYVARMVTVGQDLIIDDIRGTVIELTPTTVILKTDVGRVVVPAQRFHDTGTVTLIESA